MKAIVVGAGAAGISAAFRLQRAGFEVRVFESSAAVGGRTRSMERAGFIMDIGAGLLPSSYTALLRLLDHSGQADLLVPAEVRTGIVRDGQMHYLDANSVLRTLLGTKLVRFGSKLLLAPLAFAALRSWSRLGFANLGLAAPFDSSDESLARYVERVSNREVLEYLVNPIQKLMYVMSANEASRIDFFWCLKNLFSATAYSIRGGMGRIVEQVSRGLDVALNCEVLSVSENATHVEARVRDARGVETVESADVCVVATPANIVPSLVHGLSTRARDYLTRLRYSTLADVHVQLRTPPAETAMLIMVPDATDPDLCGIVLDHLKSRDRVPSGKGALSIYPNHIWVRQHRALSDAEIFRAIIDKVDRILPGTAATVESYHVQHWDFAATLSYPGCYRDMADFVAELDRGSRVQLAGDYFTLACVNGAVLSGELAAQRLTAHFGSNNLAEGA